jgi:hypothetical protein
VPITALAALIARPTVEVGAEVESLELVGEVEARTGIFNAARVER